MSDATPSPNNDLATLMDRDPLKLTDEDAAKIVDYLVAQRRQWEAEESKAKTQGTRHSKRAPKVDLKTALAGLDVSSIK